MTVSRLLICGLMISLFGCKYAEGMIDYRENPELRSVFLYTGRAVQASGSLGTVQVLGEGRGSCDEVANDALAELLEQARALGADEVRDVKFRGRWHWMGRVVCRRGFSGKSVQVRGTAYKSEAVTLPEAEPGSVPR